MSLPELPITVCTNVEPQPLPPSPYAFGEMEPDEQGLVGHGADFEPPTIVAAYRAGCFPWPHPSYERLWFSPDPRAILPVCGLHVSRRLARTARSISLRATHITTASLWAGLRIGLECRAEPAVAARAGASVLAAH